MAYSTLVEPFLFTLRQFTVPVLAPGTKPLRVLHISDLHLMPRQQLKADWVRSLASLEPDLVVNTAALTPDEAANRVASALPGLGPE